MNTMELVKLTKNSKYIGKHDIWGRVAWVKFDRDGRDDKVPVRGTSKSESKAVIFFQGRDKGMVLNMTNLSFLMEHWGEGDTERLWRGKEVGIYADPTVMTGRKRVGGLRLCLRKGQRIYAYSGSVSPDQAARMIGAAEPPPNLDGETPPPDPEWAEQPSAEPSGPGQLRDVAMRGEHEGRKASELNMEELMAYCAQVDDAIRAEQDEKRRKKMQARLDLVKPWFELRLDESKREDAAQ